jgi:hypothetical protein
VFRTGRSHKRRQRQGNYLHMGVARHRSTSPAGHSHGKQLGNGVATIGLDDALSGDVPLLVFSSSFASRL